MCSWVASSLIPSWCQERNPYRTEICFKLDAFGSYLWLLTSRETLHLGYLNLQPLKVCFTHFRDLDGFFCSEYPETSVLKASVLLVMSCFFWRFCTTPAHHVCHDMGFYLGAERSTEGGIAAANIHWHFAHKKGSHCYLFSLFFSLKRQQTVIGTEFQQLV